MHKSHPRESLPPHHPNSAHILACRQDEPASCLYVLISGRIRLIREDPGMRPRVRVEEEVGRGEAVGAVWALTGGIHDTTALCVRDSELVRMSKVTTACPAIWALFLVLLNLGPALMDVCSLTGGAKDCSRRDVYWCWAASGVVACLAETHPCDDREFSAQSRSSWMCSDLRIGLPDKHMASLLVTFHYIRPQAP